jgi:hypothetical protein
MGPKRCLPRTKTEGEEGKAKEAAQRIVVVEAEEADDE